jgi:hypothetical protein
MKYRIRFLAAMASLAFTATLASAQLPLAEPLPYPQMAMTMPAAGTIPTVEQFAKSFCPAQGQYEVTLLHPKTCCPVTVCFCLPCKEACKVTATKHALRFSYKGKDVVIRFKHDGTVVVRDA